MAYVTGGIAMADVDQWLCYDAGACGTHIRDLHNSGWQAGIAAGAGVEHAFTDNLSFKLEYLYVGLPTESVHSEYLLTGGSTPKAFRSNAHLIRAGLNYKFGNPASHTYALESGTQTQEMIPHDWSGFYGGIVAAGGMFTGQTPAYYSANYYDFEM